MYELKKHDGKRSRGYCTVEDIDTLRHLSCQELLEKTFSETAHERTASLRLISENRFMDAEITRLFCEKLKGEKKLYVKLEICNSLTAGGVEAAEVMVGYLGEIGENRYEILPDREFKKKSYPLPRDIIARTLAHMKPDIMPVLLKVLDTGEEKTVREVIDSIGFMCFYNDFPGKAHVPDHLKTCFEKHPDSDLIRWKLTRAFSAFEEAETCEILEGIKNGDICGMIRLEAARSLNMIKTGKKL